MDSFFITFSFIHIYFNPSAKVKKKKLYANFLRTYQPADVRGTEWEKPKGQRTARENIRGTGGLFKTKQYLCTRNIPCRHGNRDF